MDPVTQTEHSEFYTRYRGHFHGIMKWEQLDDLWQVVESNADAGWYIYAIGEAVPEQAATAEQLHTFIQKINELLRNEHEGDYCGIVYADSKADPGFIKIYDPNNLGVVCGFSNSPPLPGWILSTIKPEILVKDLFMTQSRKRWWQRIFSS